MADAHSIKAYRSGTDRTAPPDCTLSRVEPLTSGAGITRVANVTGLDVIGIPVVMVCRPNSRSLAVAQGKGHDLISATVSGLMESLETYAAERISLPLRWASANEMRADNPVVDVTGLPRARLSRYSDNLPLLWIRGTDLVSETDRWLPFELVHTNYSSPMPAGAGCFPATSNGLASGNTIDEALSHAICEVVERDATTHWSLASAENRSQTRLRLETVNDPVCRSLLDKFAHAGVSVAVWDTTSRVGIPSFLASIVDHHDDILRRSHPGRGMGCHPRREISLARALTEAAQSRLTYISGSRDDLTRAEFELAHDADIGPEHRRVVSVPPQRSFTDVTTVDHDTIQEDTRWELARLVEAGFGEVVAVDLTPPEWPIAVVRVVVPGLDGPVEEIANYVPLKARTS